MSGIEMQELGLPPPIPEHRKSVYEYYRLTFDEFGCPMKQTDSGMVFHPILAAYLIVDYMSLFKKTKDEKYIGIANRIAELALAKAEKVENALVFWYRPESNLSYVPGTFYSALTQAWYIKALCVLRPYSRKRGGADWGVELSCIFNSLLLDIERNGVLIKRNIGWIVEEYPHKIPFYTLNGWLTALRIVITHRNELSEVCSDVNVFLSQNLRAVEALLPLYDAKHCFNSRYQLSGFSRVKIIFDRSVSYSLEQFEVEIPSEGVFSGSLSKEMSRWSNYLEREEARVLQFNIVRSLISAPEENIFRFRLSVDADCSITIMLADGDYRPDATGMPTTSWIKLETKRISAGKNSCYDVRLPFDGRDNFAYPTNFKKLIGGINYNAYHFVHIIDLAELYAYSKRPIFKEYALRWLEYTSLWGNIPALKDGAYSIAPYSYGDDFSDIVKNSLDKSARWPLIDFDFQT